MTNSRSICISHNYQTFSLNVGINSLALAGAQIKINTKNWWQWASANRSGGGRYATCFTQAMHHHIGFLPAQERMGMA